KYVERAFDILQTRWKIIKEPARRWSRGKLNFIMMLCIILHNMIVKDEHDGYIDGESVDDQDDPNKLRKARAKIYDGPNLPFNPRIGSISINEYMRRYRIIRHRATNKYLQQDLVTHLWAKEARSRHLRFMFLKMLFKFHVVKCFFLCCIIFMLFNVI
ncbi:hypothetical protein KJ032_26330, partial [Salmonella enterica subsp. enterica serovar Typhimurium]|nr:hypothetical protein [Salmonella enterica subsp. enterica serovar Typhimurium]